jgi:multiple sugar transport system substrate-binding protein
MTKPVKYPAPRNPPDLTAPGGGDTVEWTNDHTRPRRYAMKRLFGIVLVLLVAATMLGFAAAKQKEPTGPIKLLFWTHEDKAREALEGQFIKDFMAQNPNVTVERVLYPSTKIQDAMLAAFAANQGPDFFNMGIEDEYQYIANARVAPVIPEAAGYSSTSAIINAYIPNVLDPVTIKGKLYGMPLELTNWCIYLNKKIFRDAGLDPDKDYPKTWEDMMTVSEKIVQRNGDIITRRGFDWRYQYSLTEIVPMVEQLGGKLVSSDGKTAIIGDEAWTKVLDYIREWGPNGKNLGAPTYKNARSLFNFDKNEVAMCSTGLYQQGRMKTDNAAFLDSKDWMVIQYPQWKNAKKKLAGCYYGHYYMVNAQKPADNQYMAWKLIGYMLSHPEDYLDKVALPQPTKKLMASEKFTSMPFSKVFASDMARAHIVYYAANSAQLQRLIGTAIEAVMLNKVPVDKALATLKKDAADLFTGD